ncbi:MAG: hypothetical protein ACRD0C_02015 [Acidimicrobiia bacterium]
MVLDEFPYLVEASPSCRMGRLLGADGPLYQRAGLSLRLGSFDVRTAARY